MPGSEWLGGVLGWTQEEVAEFAAVPRETARNRIGHFSQMVKTAKDKQSRGRTPQEIAEDVGMSDAAVRAELGDTADLEALPNLRKLAALYQDSDWTPPLYDVWTRRRSPRTSECRRASLLRTKQFYRIWQRFRIR